MPASSEATVAAYEATEVVWVRAKPEATSARRGRLVPGYAVTVGEFVDGPGCEDAWAQLDGGFACSTWLVPSELPVEGVPRLIAFDPPTPDEYATYLTDKTWDMAPLDEAPALLPFVYGKRWRSWQGHVWAGPEHYAHGDDPVGRLSRSSKHAFVDAVDTERGVVLVDDDGRAVPVDEVFVYPVDRFAGRDLGEQPVPEGRVAGWVHGYDGATLYDAPGGEARGTLAYHQSIDLDAVPASNDGRWWRLPDALGAGEDGYVDGSREVRRWVPMAPPSGVEDALWLDIDLDQQVAALRRGEQVLFLTLVSTGLGKHATPRGVYRSTDNMAWTDMANAAGAEEVYHVEKVPWIVHFWPRYAVHGAFWHWGVGHPASHGCINLAPRDAQWLSAQLGPARPDGWHTAFADEAHPGTVIRVRSGTGDVPDRR